MSNSQVPKKRLLASREFCEVVFAIAVMIAVLVYIPWVFPVATVLSWLYYSFVKGKGGGVGQYGRYDGSDD